jgi:Mg/Co/Ni transporter MgtE
MCYSLKVRIRMNRAFGQAQHSGRTAYRLLARETWRKHKGGCTWRVVAVIEIALYRISARPILANTCCTALIGNSGTAASSIPLPP